MNGRLVIYARVSTDNQCHDSQLDEVRGFRVQVTQEAWDSLRLYRDCSSSRVGRDLEPSMRGFAARWAENAFRMTLVFHAVEHGERAHLEKVSKKTAEAAINVVSWFANEQTKLIRQAAYRSVEALKEKIVTYIKRQTQASTRDITRAGLGTRSVFAERSEGGRYLDIVPNREAIARYNLSVEDINQVVEMAIGGNTIGYTVEGRERYPISVRLQRDFRDSISAIKQIPVSIPGGGQVPLSSLAAIEYSSGPPEVRSENGQLVTYVSVDTLAGDIGGYVQRAGERLHQMVHAPPGVYWEWAGSLEQLQQVKARLLVIIPFTLLIIILLIYVNTRSFVRTCIVLLAVPFSLVGAFWLLYLCGYQLSVAVAVGLIALAGIDAETGVVMLIYLDQAYDDRIARGAMNNFNDLVAAVKEGAVQRIRPKMMTMAAILFGLLPIMWSTGSGSEVMKRIAAPMIGGVVTSAILGLLLYPVLYVLWRARHLPRQTT